VGLHIAQGGLGGDAIGRDTKAGWIKMSTQEFSVKGNGQGGKRASGGDQVKGLYKDERGYSSSIQTSCKNALEK
jgi:hypothetical protein